jgi:gamma-glutamyltranspeptidase/glutathione hydrolase
MAAAWQRTAGSPFTTEKQEATAARGMVVANHPLASAAGLEMLALGGNAIDAAIATAFALTVVEPMMVSIFGAGFVNFYDARGDEVVTIDNYTVAPAAARPDMYTPVSDTWPDYLETVEQHNRVGYLAVGVPGALKSWCYVEERYGTLGLDTVLQPAIRYASRGFPASQYLVDIIGANCQTLDRFPASREIFLPGGAPPQPGHLMVRRDYAQTLEHIAREGAEVLYGGVLGEVVARDMEANGGIITVDDLRHYAIQRRDPVRGTYRGYDIVAVGPTSSGGIHIIQVLNILEAFDIASMGFGTAASIHLLAEALKIAFADRFQYLGDPAFVDIPVSSLVSKEYAALRRQEIDLEKAQDYRAGRPVVYSAESANTTHLTVADDAGNVVAMTQTLHEAFGSKVTVPGTGMLLNNTMYLFDPHPGHANSIVPGKRMVSSMSPTIIMQDGRPFMALGTPGGTRIFAAVLQAIINVIDHGMTLQEAFEAPRMWTQGQALEVETGIAASVRDDLATRGHRIQVVPKIAGGMNGVRFDHAAGRLYGAACWRADGAPAGLSGGPARAGVLDPTYGI